MATEDTVNAADPDHLMAAARRATTPTLIPRAETTVPVSARTDMVVVEDVRNGNGTGIVEIVETVVTVVTVAIATGGAGEMTAVVEIEICSMTGD